MPYGHARSQIRNIPSPPPARYEDTRDDRVMAMSTNRSIMDQKRRTEAARMDRLENKRVRLDKTELEVRVVAAWMCYGGMC